MKKDDIQSCLSKRMLGRRVSFNIIFSSKYFSVYINKENHKLKSNLPSEDACVSLQVLNQTQCNGRKSS